MKRHPDWENRLAELQNAAKEENLGLNNGVRKITDEMLQQTPDVQILHVLDLLSFLSDYLLRFGGKQPDEVAEDLTGLIAPGVSLVGLILSGLMSTHAEENWQDEISEFDLVRELLVALSPEVGVYLSILKGRHYKPA